eukprot:GHVO01029691.1.p1 GENE.GHVO01029691.1~~GHVO01029691.1.p1  ORF type:complete len:185 (-),score=33.65 GHVO01029691.1:116-670(-)
MSVAIHTTIGSIKIELYCNECPKACKNFLALAASGYYDNTKFFKNVKGFAVQAGDPTGTGKGGQSVYGQYFDDEYCTALKHDRKGVLSMSNQGVPNSNGSRFFITYARQPHLNGQYTVFARVIDGFDTLEKLEREPVDHKNRPLRLIVITGITIHANPFAENDIDPPKREIEPPSETVDEEQGV